MGIQGSRTEFKLGSFLEYRERNDPESDGYGLKSLRTELRHLGFDEWIEVSCSVGVSWYRSLHVIISAYTGNDRDEFGARCPALCSVYQRPARGAGGYR